MKKVTAVHYSCDAEEGQDYGNTKHPTTGHARAAVRSMIRYPLIKLYHSELPYFSTATVQTQNNLTCIGE